MSFKNKKTHTIFLTLLFLFVTISINIAFFTNKTLSADTSANTATTMADPTTPPPAPTTLENLFPFILLGILAYFLLIRPQQKRHRTHQEFLSKIKRGDEVLTSSGIYGRIEGLTDSFVILEIAKNVRIRLIKSQVSAYAGNPEEKNTKQSKKQ